MVASWGAPVGRGQALLGAGDQNREPTVEGEKSHRTQDGHRDGLFKNTWGGAGGDIPQHSRQLLPGARIWVQFPSTHMMAHMCGYPQFQGSDTLQ